MSSLTYYRAAERPAIQLWLQDADGSLLDLSSGYTFSFKIGLVGSAAVFTKTSGITGAAGSGTENNGTPNLTINFTAGELAAIPVRNYTWQVTATTGGLDRVFAGSITILDGVA
jgi:hypothetical protein